MRHWRSVSPEGKERRDINQTKFGLLKIRDEMNKAYFVHFLRCKPDHIPRALSFYRTDSASQERKNGSLGGVGGGGGYKIDERRDSPPLFVSSLSASKSEPPASKPG